MSSDTPHKITESRRDEMDCDVENKENNIAKVQKFIKMDMDVVEDQTVFSVLINLQWKPF